MMELRNTPKWQTGGYPRSIDPANTYRRLQPLMPTVGLTHVIEITALDDLGIPVCLAFSTPPTEADLHPMLAGNGKKLNRVLATAELFPQDASFSGKVPIFAAGKGLTPLDARVGTMMEAVERYSARSPSMVPVVGSYRQMQKRGDAEVVDPRTLILISPDSYNEDLELEWVVGTDLGSGEDIWVPADAATLLYQPQLAGRVCCDTATGLGAGNTVEEAVSHGLTEVIEHDAWTLAVVRSVVNSAQRGILEILFTETDKIATMSRSLADEAEDYFPSIDINSLENSKPGADLLDKIREAEVKIRVHDITSDIGIPAFSVSMEGILGMPDGGGLGAHPDASLALTRALTEAAQQRLVLGLRSLSTRLQLPTGWHHLPWEKNRVGPKISVPRRFEAIPSFMHQDILDDIKHMLEALETQGLDKIIVVDLTKPETNVPVVKVMVPGSVDFWTSDTPPRWEALGPRVMRYLD